MGIQYRRSRIVEPFRKLARVVDLLTLLMTLRVLKMLPAFSTLRKTVLIELGPGPTRLAALKRVLFHQVYFVDKHDFDVTDQNLRLFDLERCTDARKILHDVCKISPGDSVLIFGDHFLEHMTPGVAEEFLRTMKDGGISGCFRVPNVLSSGGKRHYTNDPTHNTPFDVTLRRRVDQLGFRIMPWLRWYRVRLLIAALINQNSMMSVAEEIVICGRPGT